MNAWPSHTGPGTCQAENGCPHPPCFQARLEAEADGEPFREQAESCADHLGDMVQALSAWACEHEFTNATLTVLAVDPAPHGDQQALPFSFISLPSRPDDWGGLSHQ